MKKSSNPSRAGVNPKESPFFIPSYLVTNIYPWAKYLPEHEFLRFVEDVLQASLKCYEAKNYLGHCLAGWKSTAEAYSDPKFRVALKSAIRAANMQTSLPRPKGLRRKRPSDHIKAIEDIWGCRFTGK